MTGIDHSHSETVVQAAHWLKTQKIPPRAVVPALQERFGLSAIEACVAIAQARGLPVRRAGA